jgi:hypothetical protein
MQLVVLTGHVNKARAETRLAHDRTDDAVVRLRPVAALFQLPDIDNVADEVQRFL